MHSSETIELRRAVLLLLTICIARWSWMLLTAPPPRSASVLPGLTSAAEEALEGERSRGRPLAPGEKIDPNRATEVELDRLPGVGVATARAIVGARDTGVVFRRPEDLEAVRGIGPASIERFRGLLDFSRPPFGPAGPSIAGGRVDVNRAGPDELKTLPGVGPAIAARIIDRRRKIPFGSVDDLLEVRGIGPATLERIRSRVTVTGRR